MFKELIELTESFKKDQGKSCEIPVYVVKKCGVNVNVSKYLIVYIHKDSYRSIILTIVKEKTTIPRELVRFSSSDEIIRTTIQTFIEGQTWGYHEERIFFCETESQAKKKATELKKQVIKDVRNGLIRAKKELKRLEQLLLTLKENKNASNS